MLFYSIFNCKNFRIITSVKSKYTNFINYALFNLFASIYANCRVENTRTKQQEAFPCGLLIYCLGYESMVLDGVPKNDKVACVLRKRVNTSCFEGTIAMSDYWRVSMPSACPTRVYATGWCAHGPQGVIVQTQQQSAAVAETISTDLKQIQLQKQSKLVIIVTN